MPAFLSASPSSAYTRRTVAPSTRAASNMLVAFQIVSGSLAVVRSTFSTCSSSRTDCEIDRLPADSITMKRSPGFS